MRKQICIRSEPSHGEPFHGEPFRGELVKRYPFGKFLSWGIYASQILCATLDGMGPQSITNRRYLLCFSCVAEGELCEALPTPVPTPAPTPVPTTPVPTPPSREEQPGDERSAAASESCITAVLSATVLYNLIRM